MYTGMMIEELIQAVARAEEQARACAQAPAPVQVPVQILRPPAPLALSLAHDRAYVAPMVGVA
ncbi:MAG TPA: hypothetical protein VLT85_04300 [Terriglobales bacterium]|nr:hypothetical protein [Terriglobales bacterium]